MAGVAVVMIATASALHAQLASPVGSWDFVLQGDQKGVAQITFNPDFTLDGTEVITIKPKAKSGSDDPRSGLDGGDRTDDDSSSGSTNTFFYGSSPISGVWSQDSSGRILGLVIEGGSSLTNGISVRGKVRGQRINLVGHHEGRTIHYRGVPLMAQPDISGNFFATGQKDGEPYIELFSLTPDVTMNRYLVTGQGPAYDFVGYALLSGQKNLAIASIQSIGTNGVLSAVSGSYNVGKGRGSLTGIDENHDRVSAKVRKQ